MKASLKGIKNFWICHDHNNIIIQISSFINFSHNHNLFISFSNNWWAWRWTKFRNFINSYTTTKIFNRYNISLPWLFSTIISLGLSSSSSIPPNPWPWKTSNPQDWVFRFKWWKVSSRRQKIKPQSLSSLSGLSANNNVNYYADSCTERVN